MSQTIYSLATPPGRSGVAVIRLSGLAAHVVAQELAGPINKPRHAYYRSFVDPNTNAVIDDGLVLYFPAPNSFTGEDVVEFQLHGSRAGISAMMNALSHFPDLGLAKPGEFTRRALENGRLDMLQVEALGDFIEADTESQRLQAQRGLRGEATDWTENLRSELIEVMALVTAAIDFSEEELSPDLNLQISNKLFHVKQAIAAEVKNSERGRALRDGFRVAILGFPNVGKSSLLNAIAGRDVAIATEIPGTTRDVLELFADIHGVPVLFYDTAGLRETDDIIEAIGVERAKKAAIDADLRIFLYEDRQELDVLSIQPLEADLVYQSKSDIYGVVKRSISSKTGQGIDELLEEIISHFPDFEHQVLFSHERQIHSLTSCLTSLEAATEIAKSPTLYYELLAEALRQAAFELDRLIGRVDVEDMLDVIFSKFCIGK